MLRATESRWRGLPRAIRRRVHLVSLPMDDLEENALEEAEKTYAEIRTDSR